MQQQYEQAKVEAKKNPWLAGVVGFAIGWVVFWLLSALIFSMGGGSAPVENAQMKDDLEQLGITDSDAADEF